MFCNKTYPILLIEKQKQSVKKALVGIASQALLDKDRQKCAMVIEEAKNYKHYKDLCAEIRNYKNRPDASNQRDILIREKRAVDSEIERLAGDLFIFALPVKPVVESSPDLFNVFSHKDLDAPILNKKCIKGCTLDHFIVEAYDNIVDNTGILSLTREFVERFLLRYKFFAYNKKSNVNDRLEVLARTFNGLLRELRIVLGKKGAAEVSQYVAGQGQNSALYVTVIEKVMHLWKGCIDVDDYVSFMVEFQYTIEVAHSHIRHVTFLMCGLLEILNKSKEHGPGYVVDKSDVIRLFDAINESIRRVQCVGVENGIQASPSITDYYQKTFPDMYTIEYMLRHHTKSNKRKVGGMIPMETYVFESPTTKCRFETEDILQLINHGAYVVDPTNDAKTEQSVDFFRIMKHAWSRDFFQDTCLRADLPDILQVKDRYTFEVSGKRFTTEDVKDLVIHGVRVQSKANDGDMSKQPIDLERVTKYAWAREFLSNCKI
jgi:hypothetical protein